MTCALYHICYCCRHGFSDFSGRNIHFYVTSSDLIYRTCLTRTRAGAGAGAGAKAGAGAGTRTRTKAGTGTRTSAGTGAGTTRAGARV